MRERETEREKRKGVSTFSLRFTEIRPSVFVGERGKVGPCNESYAWVIWEFRQTPRGREFFYSSYF